MKDMLLAHKLIISGIIILDAMVAFIICYIVFFLEQ